MKRQRTTPYYIYSTALTLLLALALAACWPSTDRRHMEALVAEADSMNRNYLDFTTDSAMLLAAGYFDRHGTPNERMKGSYQNEVQGMKEWLMARLEWLTAELQEPPAPAAEPR